MKLILIVLLLSPLPACVVVVGNGAAESNTKERDGLYEVAHPRLNPAVLDSRKENRSMKSMQLDSDQIRRVEFLVPVRLNLVFGGESYIRLRGDPAVVEKVDVIRDGDQRTIDSISHAPGLLEVDLAAVSIDSIRLLKRGPVKQESAYSGMVTVKIEDDITTRIDEIVAGQINILMNDYGKLRVGNLASERIKVVVRDQGNFSVGNALSEELDVVIEGHGGISFSGRTDSQTIRMYGYGRYSADELESKSADLFVRGYGASHLWVNDNLRLDVRQYASVHYRGEPVLSL